MRLLVFMPLLAATACLIENGAFDAASSSGGSSTAVTTAPTSGSDSGSGSTNSGTTALTLGATSEALTDGSSTGKATTSQTTGETTTSQTTGETTGDTGEPLDEPTLCGKPQGAWKISGPKKLGMPVNGANADLDMWLSEPGVLLIWSSYRDGKVDTYRATRNGFGDDFDQAFNNNADIGLSTPGEDTKVALSKDGERAYLASRMPGDPVARLYVGDRNDGSYAPLSQVVLDFPGYPNVYDPHISTDDLRLYYAASSANDQKLVVATRPGPDQPFGAPSAALFVNLDEADHAEADPTLPAHELVVIYARQRPLAEGGSDIYYALRASKDDPFGAPQKLPAVNSDLHDMSPHISRDGCELFFIRGTMQEPSNWDIYRVEIQ